MSSRATSARSRLTDRSMALGRTAASTSAMTAGSVSRAGQPSSRASARARGQSSFPSASAAQVAGSRSVSVTETSARVVAAAREQFNSSASSSGKNSLTPGSGSSPWSCAQSGEQHPGRRAAGRPCRRSLAPSRRRSPPCRRPAALRRRPRARARPLVRAGCARGPASAPRAGPDGRRPRRAVARRPTAWARGGSRSPDAVCTALEHMADSRSRSRQFPQLRALRPRPQIDVTSASQG